VAREAQLDPVDQLLFRHAFQRECVDLAHKTGRAISGQVGDHGVMFLSAATGSLSRRRQGLLDLADKAATLAKRFGFRFHSGLSTLPNSATLSQHYEAALGAAESALSQGGRLVESATPASARLPLHELRQHIGELVEERPGELPARFDRYLEAIAMHCGHRLEPARAHLEAGFEYLAGALLDAGALDEKTFVETCQGLERSARDARTVAELFDAYRRTVLELSDESLRPGAARQARSLRRAVTYIHQHYAEALRLSKVARLAGFAPTYFSYLFKKREGMTFERYVQRLRVERAKQLLVSTDLELQRVAQLSGFGTRFYLARVFKRAVGMTPVECRKRMSRYRKKVQQKAAG
jgi:AraC-like DNA-binding protein